MSLLIIWLGLGLLLAPFSYAVTFGYFQGKYSAIAKFMYRRDRALALLMAFFTVFNPFIFFLNLFLSDFAVYGLKWK